MLMMKYETIDYWDESIWVQAKRLYNEAFPEHGRKTEKIIRSMLDKKLAKLHTATDDSGTVAAMALTGKLEGISALLIDYVAVRQELRSQGLGELFLDYLKDWAVSVENCVGIVIEIESDINLTNSRRLHFWEKSGFQITDYVHTYIWVPEPYRALYLQLDPHLPLPQDGETLFRHINRFHTKAYTGN
jgi:GNAT superfamily N-acetyltransferase